MAVLMAHYRELHGQRATGRHVRVRERCGEARGARRRCGAVARALMPRCMASDRCLELHVTCRACGHACCGRTVEEDAGHRDLDDFDQLPAALSKFKGQGFKHSTINSTMSLFYYELAS